jgi:hypothetical protein
MFGTSDCCNTLELSAADLLPALALAGQHQQRPLLVLRANTHTDQHEHTQSTESRDFPVSAVTRAANYQN